jgi:non-ribosomal peptide synthetase component F
MIGKKFEEQVIKTPHHTAIKSGNRLVTYEQLNRYANRVAWLILNNLESTRSGPAQRVSLLFDHGVHMIAAVLGTLKAGRAYVPLSIDYPGKRLAYMVDNSESSLVLARSGLMSPPANWLISCIPPVPPASPKGCCKPMKMSYIIPGTGCGYFLLLAVTG